MRFLKHLSRTRFLLHLVDVAPPATASSVAADVRGIAAELERHSAELGATPRWLVFNKIDLVPEERRGTLVDDSLEQLSWRGPGFAISAIDGGGCESLCRSLMASLEG